MPSVNFLCGLVLILGKHGLVCSAPVPQAHPVETSAAFLASPDTAGVSICQDACPRHPAVAH